MLPLQTLLPLLLVPLAHGLVVPPPPGGLTNVIKKDLEERQSPEIVAALLETYYPLSGTHSDDETVNLDWQLVATPAEDDNNYWERRDGTKRDGTKRDGTKRDGTKRDGTKRDGTKRDGTKRDGTKRDGTKRDGTKRDGTKRDGTKRDGTKRDEFDTSAWGKREENKNGGRGRRAWGAVIHDDLPPADDHTGKRDGGHHERAYAAAEGTAAWGKREGEGEA